MKALRLVPVRLRLRPKHGAYQRCTPVFAFIVEALRLCQALDSLWNGFSLTRRVPKSAVFAVAPKNQHAMPALK